MAYQDLQGNHLKIPLSQYCQTVTCSVGYYSNLYQYCYTGDFYALNNWGNSGQTQVVLVQTKHDLYTLVSSLTLQLQDHYYMQVLEEYCNMF